MAPDMKDARKTMELWWAAAYLAAATLLLLSWMGPAWLRPLWDHWDMATFLALNGSLAEPGPWQTFWVMSNSRYFDLVPAALLLGVYATWLFAARAQAFRARLHLGLMMAVFNVVWLQIMMKGTLETLRDSPSLVVPEAIRIGSLVEWIPRVKDHSNHSFPGDHAAVGLLVALIILHAAGWKRGVAALAVAAFFSLPRLFGGGHWLTDVVIGGGFGALTGIAVFLVLRSVWPRVWAPDRSVSP
jgi:membrane-associated phospholipid phosphatase